jgi:hypothetical protein
MNYIAGTFKRVLQEVLNMLRIGGVSATDVREVNWSDLQRDPKMVAEIADEDGGVRVIRRDGVNLILTREDRVERASAGAVIAARAMRGILQRQMPDDFGEAMLKEFPWIRLLPREDLKTFFRDFFDATLAAAELMHWGIVDQVFNEWKTTALIYADSKVRASLTGPIESDLGPVPSPADDGLDDAEER